MQTSNAPPIEHASYSETSTFSPLKWIEQTMGDLTVAWLFFNTLLGEQSKCSTYCSYGVSFSVKTGQMPHIFPYIVWKGVVEHNTDDAYGAYYYALLLLTGNAGKYIGEDLNYAKFKRTTY